LQKKKEEEEEQKKILAGQLSIEIIFPSHSNLNSI
jgi:hypothetical protein